MAYIGAGITRFNTADDLTVTDDAEIGDNATVGGNLSVTGTTTLTDDLAVDTDTLFVDVSENRVGIGTSSPASKLEASISSAGSVAYPLRARNSGTTTGSSVGLALTTNTTSGSDASCTVVADATSATGNLDLVFSNSNTGSLTERMRIDSSGKILAATGGGWTGTVAESSTSSVFERGSNANGEYVKFADGTMITTTIAEFNFSGFTNFDVSLPSSFVNNNYGVFLSRSESGTTVNTDAKIGCFSDSVSSARFQLPSADATSGLLDCCVTAIGRWY